MQDKKEQQAAAGGLAKKGRRLSPSMSQRSPTGNRRDQGAFNQKMMQEKAPSTIQQPAQPKATGTKQGFFSKRADKDAAEISASGGFDKFSKGDDFTGSNNLDSSQVSGSLNR